MHSETFGHTYGKNPGCKRTFHGFLQQHIGIILNRPLVVQREVPDALVEVICKDFEKLTSKW